MQVFLKPGSTEAIEAGCTCPILGNNYGVGWPRPGIFIYAQDCSVHEGGNKRIPLVCKTIDKLATTSRHSKAKECTAGVP